MGGYFSKHYSVWIRELQAMTLLNDNVSRGTSQASIGADGERALAFEDCALHIPKGQPDEMGIVNGSKETVEQEEPAKPVWNQPNQPSGPGGAEAAALPGEVSSKP